MRAPRAGRDDHLVFCAHVPAVSIYAPREGCDLEPPPRCQTHRCFNPRAPCGARLRTDSDGGRGGVFQSTRPVRGATTVNTNYKQYELVSIHAPRAGRDRACLCSREDDNRFNPRAPCGARRLVEVRRLKAAMFQSTRPVRGATYCILLRWV